MWKIFKNDQQGSMSVMFAGCAMAVLLLIGISYDLSTAASEKQQFQNYSDAAVLAAARSGLTEKKDLQAVAEEMVKNLIQEADERCSLCVLFIV
ncbi:MAG TPA: hypothetical protein ENK06_11650 [Gammaproteobacteria bacterium]|nr:hypothetical protein [Gammaproteobacteria bacterium]